MFYWNGTIKTCLQADFTATRYVSVGSESIGTLNDQNLDVHWEAMKYQNSSYDWVNWGAGTNCANAPYPVRVISKLLQLVRRNQQG